MFERQSALGNNVSGEVRGWALVQVAAFHSTHAELRATLGAQLGVDLPTTIGQVIRANSRMLLKTGAEQYWILSPEAVNLDIPAAIGAVTSLSHSRTCLFIEGPEAARVLAKGVPLDFHPDVFPVDHFALTGIHHTPVLIHRKADTRYEIYALRTYAQTVREWLTDAAIG